METRRERRGSKPTNAGGARVARRSTHSDALLSALAASPLFGDLPDRLLRDLLGAFRYETWQKRSLAMTPAHTAGRFYVIVAGRLKVCRINPDTGREVGLMLLGRGDAFDVERLACDHGQVVAAGMEWIIGVVAPRHGAGIGVDVRSRNVRLRSDVVAELRDEAARDMPKVGLGELRGIAGDAPLWRRRKARRRPEWGAMIVVFLAPGD